MKFSSVSIQKGSILIAAAGAALASCILSLPPAMSAPEEGTNNRGLQNNESKGKDGAQSAEPGTGNLTPAAEKKKNPFGTKPKGPVGNALLETKRPLVKACWWHDRRRQNRQRQIVGRQRVAQEIDRRRLH